jgi:hypothetical protein
MRIGVALLGVFALLVFAWNVATGGAPSSEATEPKVYTGCTPGFWKNHPKAWFVTAYWKDKTIGEVFDIPAEFSELEDDTLLEALSYKGGPDDIDAARLLLHHAVAAILNATHPAVDYPMFAVPITEEVSDALATSDRDTMLDLKDKYAGWNEAGCPTNGKEEVKKVE